VNHAISFHADWNEERVRLRKQVILESEAIAALRHFLGQLPTATIMATSNKTEAISNAIEKE